jgi:3-dehydroquinate synthetase
VAAQEEDRPLIAAETIRNHDLGYPILIGWDLDAEIARFAAQRDAIVVLHDAAAPVARIARRITARLGKRRRTAAIGVPLGERRKRLVTVERVAEALLAAGADRGTLVLGIGGGVASDLFGFTAATYMRGVAYAHVATSLVAMVDAAIGGKTGVDLPGGKNLTGVFADPVAVFCDVGALDTLPFRALREGLAEVVKAAVIEGGGLFEGLETLAAHPFSKWPWPGVVAAAVNVKTAIVAEDRLESGKRELLNLGHTFAHGIERASNYRVMHGAAVALGLQAAGLLALERRTFDRADFLRVLALLALLGMPMRTSLAPERVFAAMASDKKRRAGKLRFVLPRAIGDVEYGVACGDRAVRGVLARLREGP